MEHVLYRIVRYRTGGQLPDGDGPPVGTPYKVKSCPQRGPCDVASSQRFPSVGTRSSPPYGGDESVPYKVGLTPCMDRLLTYIIDPINNEDP